MAELGQMVVYNTTENERKQMILSGARARKQLPATIVYVIDTNSVHLQVFIDGGEGLMYVAPSHEGSEEGQWSSLS